MYIRSPSFMKSQAQRSSKKSIVSGVGYRGHGILGYCKVAECHVSFHCAYQGAFQSFPLIEMEMVEDTSTERAKKSGEGRPWMGTGANSP